jgi:hypothetical protein
LKIESEESLRLLFVGQCKKTLNVALGPVYFLGAHWYDGFCYVVSNALPLSQAFVFMFFFLASLSAVLVFIHEITERRMGWDIMNLQEFKDRDQNKIIPPWRAFKRFKRWMVLNSRITFWLGSWTVGPPIVTILLRKEANWKQNMVYILPGSLLSVLIWVPIWTGLGEITWKQYIVPLWNKLF